MSRWTIITLKSFWQVAFLIFSHYQPGQRNPQVNKKRLSFSKKAICSRPQRQWAALETAQRQSHGVWPSEFPRPPATLRLLAGAAPESHSPHTGSGSLYRQWVFVTAQFLVLQEGLAQAQTAGSHFDPRWHRSKPPLFGFLIPDWHSLASGDKCWAEDNVDPLWQFSGKDFSE